MLKLISSIVLIPTFAFALPVKTGEKFRVQIPGEYIVKTSNIKSLLNVKKKLGEGLYLVKANNIKSLNLGSQKVFPNYRYFGDFKESTNTPNDIEFNKQHHHSMINTLGAWNISKGSKEIVVAITDNEFQTKHEDLVDSWFQNTQEIPGNNIDDDGNGYIDDIIGWDFVNNDNDTITQGESTHGTHIAGIIAAASNNQLGGAGIAPNVKLLPLKWYETNKPWTTAMIVETYEYAIKMGANIITTSYGIDHLADDEAYLDVVQRIKANNILLFNSAGNANKENPKRQSIEDVILVCSVKSKNDDTQDEKSSFSNYGTGIDICAPGDPIYSTVNRADDLTAHGNLSGTSMAAPAAAAVAALIWSAHPNYSAQEVKQKLYDSAEDISAKNSKFDGKLGVGRINAELAVK